MVTNSIIQYLLSDQDSLQSYDQEKNVTFKDVKRRLFLLERGSECHIPDHYYKLNEEKSFEGIHSLAEIMTKGLPRIACEYLEMRERRIYVKQTKQNEWQQLITRIPPLLLQASFLYAQEQQPTGTWKDQQAYFRKYIVPNTKNTALPHPYIPQLEYDIKNKNGFQDLHIHLTGTTETDRVWQDFLYEPDKAYKDLKDGFNNPMVREQFEQELQLASPYDFLKRLHKARNIRTCLYRGMIGLEKSNFALNKLDGNEEYPFSTFANELFGDSHCEGYEMSVECFMYVKIFNYLTAGKDESVRESAACLFHYYLLILGSSNRLLVQQTHQKGFAQFQKNTLNELRSGSEKQFKNRFLQMHGNDFRNIAYIEGRFSPKDLAETNRKLLHDINEGWEGLKKTLCKNDESMPTLKLIAHFIKSADHNWDKDEIRHKKLRRSIIQKAEVLSLMKENADPLVVRVVGIDAASSEFDAPPEVFAPAFCELRRRGFKHFTYHAGEDFYHILSGLRAIYESIEFLELEYGDRIGHATATGIDVRLWHQIIGKRMLIRQGEYLDNLVFAYHLILDKNIERLNAHIPLLSKKIEEHYFKIYKEYYSITPIVEAWLLRKVCPNKLFSESNCKDIKPCKDVLVNILRKYHECKEDYAKIIEIDTLDVFNAEAIIELQLAVLKHMHGKEIVIETLPTSNVRIGYHLNFDSYHLWNWMRWKKEGYSIPPIVVGTDDPGIFATNIYNEYCNIYCNLVHQQGKNHDEVMKFIEELDRNATIYRFS